MFQWLTNPFRRSRLRRERFIFHYQDGSRKRSADPIMIERVLSGHLGTDWRAKLKQHATPIPLDLIGTAKTEAWIKRDKLRESILDSIDAAFGVEPYKDGKGLTDPERFGLLQAFQLFIIDLAEYASPFVSVLSRDSPSVESQPIENGVDSTSPDTTSTAPARAPSEMQS